MEFINIGGGEILVIILLAIILFGPEDILKIMRAVGGYVRKIQRMWAQVSAGLKGEFIPDEIIPEEVQEVIKETKVAVDEVKTTLNEVKTTVQTDIDDTQATVDEVKESLKDVDTTVKSDLSTIPQSLRKTARDAVKKKEEPQPENEPDPESVTLIAALLDDSSGSNSDEATDEAESTTTEDVTAIEDEVTSEADAVTSAADADSTHSSDDVDDVYTKNAALIAAMLEPKHKDADDSPETATGPTEETTPEAEALIAPAPAAEVAPEAEETAVSGETVPVSPSEPVTEAPQIEEV